MAKPPSDDPRNITISFRVTSGERAEIDRNRSGTSLSDWVRRKVLGRG